MKKLFLLFATVTLLAGFQACKQQEETADETTEVPATAEPAAIVSGDSVATDVDTSDRGGQLPPPPIVNK